MDFYYTHVHIPELLYRGRRALDLNLYQCVFAKEAQGNGDKAGVEPRGPEIHL